MLIERLTKRQRSRLQNDLTKAKQGNLSKEVYAKNYWRIHKLLHKHETDTPRDHSWNAPEWYWEDQKFIIEVLNACDQAYKNAN